MEPAKAQLLCVDDHEDCRLMLLVMLEQEGYSVFTASTIADALTLDSQFHFDLYLLDIRLPDGSGVDLCQQLHQRHPTTPVIYITALAYPHDKLCALTACGEEYLRKPIDIEELKAVVSRLLARCQ